MNPGLHPWRNAVILLVSVVGLGLALRQDLANFARDRHILAHALGVASYRQGRFDAAENYFSTATVAPRPDLAAAAYFNRGNARFRRAQQMAAEQRAQAVQTMRAASADFEQALQLEADAVDAQENLHRARNWIMQWTPDASGKEETARPAGEEPAQSSNGGRPAKEKLVEASRAVSSSRPLSGKMTTLGDASGQGDPPRKPERELTPDEAERLLSEARHREKILGLPDTDSRHAGRESPERDW